jgi:hypothetical protein
MSLQGICLDVLSLLKLSPKFSDKSGGDAVTTQKATASLPKIYNRTK